MNDLHIAVMPKDILALLEPHLPTEYSTAMSVEWQKESLGASLVSFDDYVYFIKHKTELLVDTIIIMHKNLLHMLNKNKDISPMSSIR